MKKYILIYLFFHLLFFVYPQKQKSDSLLLLLEKSIEDTVKVKTLLLLTQHHNFTGDLAKKYSEEALSLAQKISYSPGIAEAFYNLARYDYYISSYRESIEKSKKAYYLFRQLSDSNGMALSLMALGDAHYSMDFFRDAILFYDSSIVLFKKTNSEIGTANCLMSKGDVYYVQDNYTEALINYKKALEFFEKNNSPLGIANCINCIADVLFDQEDYVQAKEKYQKAKSLFEPIRDDLGLGNCTKRLGDIEFRNGNYGKALELFNEAYRFYSKSGSINGLGNVNRNLAEVLIKQKKYSFALDKLNEAITIFTETGDDMGLSNCYINIATIKKEQGKFSEGIQYAEIGFRIANEIMTPEIVQVSAFELGELYSKKGQFEKAFYFQRLYAQIKDSINSNANVKKITRMQMQIDFEQKEREQLLIQKQKDLVKDAKIEQQKIVRNAFIGGFFLVLMLSFFIYKNYHNKQKANLLLAEKNQIIELKNKEITDSIEYAQHIQKAMLVSDEFLRGIFPEHFVLFKPRDIISGDFYWAAPLTSLKEDNSLLQNALPPHPANLASPTSQGGLIAVGDCTGHGVPGALMSMIGNTLLNKIVSEDKIEKPSEILNSLRAGVINILHQKGGERDSRDGMDMAVCKFCKTENGKWKMDFAGAHNPVWIIQTQSSQIKELKPDNLPVGFFWGEQKIFTNHSLEITSGDMIYLFSDGYSDQFGGQKKKKFKQSRLKTLLQSIYCKSLEEQKEILNTSFDEWKGDLEQVDDICIIGVRV